MPKRNQAIFQRVDGRWPPCIYCGHQTKLHNKDRVSCRCHSSVGYVIDENLAWHAVDLKMLGVPYPDYECGVPFYLSNVTVLSVLEERVMTYITQHSSEERNDDALAAARDAVE